MTRHPLDTNIAIQLPAAVPGLSTAAVERIADGSVPIGSCSVGELHAGVYSAREYGRLRAAMKRQGNLIPTMDTQVAATARVHGLIGVSADRHPLMVAGLTVENWLEPPAEGSR